MKSAKCTLCIVTVNYVKVFPEGGWLSCSSAQGYFNLPTTPPPRTTDHRGVGAAVSSVRRPPERRDEKNERPRIIINIIPFYVAFHFSAFTAGHRVLAGMVASTLATRTPLNRAKNAATRSGVSSITRNNNFFFVELPSARSASLPSGHARPRSAAY